MVLCLDIRAHVGPNSAIGRKFKNTMRKSKEGESSTRPISDDQTTLDEYDYILLQYSEQ